MESEMLSCCYSADIYCSRISVAPVRSEAIGETAEPGAHYFQEFPHQFLGYDRADVMRQIKKAGWKFTRDHTQALCPRCIKAGFTIAKIGDLRF